eukprot:GHVP01052269.1.p1 GENE.GHVP01052269.1~~GHVP01052269.1.p1  ORF type:complete len:372 (-),score=70.65 GHVP01052269.1:2615-3730(-)
MEGSKRVCVKEGGEITLSAGAIFTPKILFDSGVGPINQIKELKVPLVKEVPDLGQHMKDRTFVPMAMFRKEPVDQTNAPSRVCQAVGLMPVGENCNGKNMGDPESGCSTLAFEEISGGRLPEGLLYASRFIFPPERRDDPLVDFIIKVTHQCTEGKNPFGVIPKSKICPFVKAISDCFGRIAANFYLPTEPLSSGHMSVSKTGRIFLEANYFQHPQDMDYAVQGLSEILKTVKSGIYNDFLEPLSSHSCPLQILNTFLIFMTKLDRETRTFVPDADYEYMKKYIDLHLKYPNDQPRTTEQSMKETESLIKNFSRGETPATYPPILPDLICPRYGIGLDQPKWVKLLTQILMSTASMDFQLWMHRYFPGRLE